MPSELHRLARQFEGWSKDAKEKAINFKGEWLRGFYDGEAGGYEVTAKIIRSVIKSDLLFMACDNCRSKVEVSNMVEKSHMALCKECAGKTSEGLGA